MDKPFEIPNSWNYYGKTHETDEPKQEEFKVFMPFLPS
jgi:hypothetical protein